MLSKILALAFLLGTAAATAQPAAPPEPAFLQQAIVSLQAQRNEAMDRAATAEAYSRMFAAENESLKAKIRELEAKAAPKP